MGGGAGARVVYGSIAAVVAGAAATVDIPEKLQQKVTPILYYAVPVSMPLPPPDSHLSGSCACVDLVSAASLSRILPATDCARDSSYASSRCSLAQGASRVVSSLSGSSRRAISHFLPVYPATNVAPPSGFALRSGLYPAATVTPPALGRFAFSPPGLYAAPVTAALQGSAADAKRIGEYARWAYLEFLLPTLSNFQGSRVDDFTHPSRYLHTWHAPSSGRDVKLDGVRRPDVTVVLLGWLGAQQKHFKKYTEWYNDRGIHVVTFVIPMTDILSFKVERNADEHVDSLARHLGQWLSSDQDEHEGEKQLMFHTFSNTGWLTYGAILEKMAEQGEFVGRIKGCVIDSAPVPNPDPQVWASGFSAALLKKRSGATQPVMLQGEAKEGVSVEAASQGGLANLELGGANGLETAVHSVLEGFFSFFLKLPAIKQRLSEVVTILQKKQPPCPQLYIYSTADKVIPAKAVEAFIEEQRKTGRVVRACNLQSSPHVDHFRSHPQLYSEQLSKFLKEVLPSTHAQLDAL